MNHFTRFDATSSLDSIQCQLYSTERILVAQSGVGLYDGKEKDATHSNGTLHLTSHRIIYIDHMLPHIHSAALSLKLVRQTEYWTGMFSSSPKITLLLGDPGSTVLAVPLPIALPSSSSAATSATRRMATSEQDSGEAAANAQRNKWICRVCGMKNELQSSSSRATVKCGLCGVARQLDQAPKKGGKDEDGGEITKGKGKGIGIGKASGFASLPPSRTATPSLPSFTSASSEVMKATTARSEEAIIDDGNEIEKGSMKKDADQEKDKRIVCRVCTFLNHPSMGSCEVCDTPLGLGAPKRSTSTTASSFILSPSSSSSSPSLSAAVPATKEAPFVRLSFRKGGEKVFYASLKSALEKKEWDAEIEVVEQARARKPGGGIDAILRGIDLDVSQRGDEMEDALQDLNALMAKAKEMIQLAQSINERLSQQEASAAVASNPSAPSTSTSSSTLIRSSLLSLGLPTPAITPDMIADQNRYHEALAKELGAVLGRKGGVMEKGIVGLDEAWCVWNRARGVALVSPKDLKLASTYLSQHTSPRIHFRILPYSRLPILHTARFSSRAFAIRLLELLDLKQAIALSASLDRLSVNASAKEREREREKEGATILEVARMERISIPLVEEMVGEVAARAEIVMDDQGSEGVRWYRNSIIAFVWEDSNIYR